MGENEMKPRPGLPCGVRLTAGLGGAGGPSALALAAEAVAEPEQRVTLDFGVVSTAGSVPELASTAPTREQDWRCIPSRLCARTEPKPMLTVRATSGVVLCCRRAARRRTGSHHKAHALAVSRAKDGAGNRAMAVCSTGLPASSSAARCEQRRREPCGGCPSFGGPLSSSKAPRPMWRAQ